MAVGTATGGAGTGSMQSAGRSAFDSELGTSATTAIKAVYVCTA